MDKLEDHDDNNLQSQIEEIEALSSIYGEEWCVIDEAARVFCIRISETQQPKWTVCLQIILPPDYPSSAPPIYQINAAWLRGQDRMTLSNSLEEIYVENAGESILYLWVEKIREFLTEKSQHSDGPDTCKTVMTEEGGHDCDEDDLPDISVLKLSSQSEQIFSPASDDEELPLIKHGESITDRRSTFQPHLSAVENPKQVQRVLNKLYENKKIASATHNIYAYRIYCQEKNSVLQDCEDDGETAAGGRLLHLLQILDVRNVLVVVSRWYGGILLGPDRFKHINNCARTILIQEGYADSTEETSKAGGKSKKPKSKKTK
ncbi:protein IMPACT isoform X1 [Danio rerio]|uniref:Protein IMPACT n=4 Tax=Euteleostomi TaxID=117571 RepID=IMPCT_DANRE|nr:protein IMPACT [Danio rerio]XP_017208604.1 protein IMPACT isoform X1 [Danio rerio]XP_017208605.1 protein IMPACT isoform X1 [Danio rerio]XP_017208606.1 protein IMPACT isoform X1 [Danio rerio]XP_017208607.1 protein IMPACT isoform X1 [Danio rerio]A9UMG5.1 RecName: Full=Protein IMPACT-B; AltName: Full=Imprinted and ancient gene protein homolog B [Xenopus tropicalis]Q642J4.1 RecName: Full=Protein IMPACT; AltName: Full=Imprinted and ancient gene protein homolog [Danio rerio]AAH81507.1 Zgc:10367|eukprot:NP_001005595.1 protein IMPACT [Danio rerio]